MTDFAEHASAFRASSHFLCHFGAIYFYRERAFVWDLSNFNNIPEASLSINSTHTRRKKSCIRRCAHYAKVPQLLRDDMRTQIQVEEVGLPGRALYPRFALCQYPEPHDKCRQVY
jgi:hypothetical protein